MRIAVVADTHSHVHPTTDALLRDYAPNIILHAGDIGDLDVLDDLATIAPVHAVRGNIDGRDDGLPDAIAFDIYDPALDTPIPGGDHPYAPKYNDDARLLTIYMTHIAVYGPRLNRRTRTSADQHRADLVVCGHSHVPLLLKDRGMPVFNPGSCGPRRPPLPILFGTMDLTPTGTRFQHINCETGASWRPGDEERSV